MCFRSSLESTCPLRVFQGKHLITCLHKQAYMRTCLQTHEQRLLEHVA